MKHITKTIQLNRTWIESEVFHLSDKLRNENPISHALEGRSLYCLFYEPSFLTRTSFERAIGLLGGLAYHTEDASQFFPVQTPNYIENVVSMLASLHIDIVVLRSSDGDVVERAEASDAISIINGGNDEDHPTQAIADIYTIHRELGGVDGIELAIIGRLEHRNVAALLRGISLFRDIKVRLIPFSGQVSHEIRSYCELNEVNISVHSDIEAVEGVDAVYLNGPRTVGHLKLMRSRNSFSLKIDRRFMSMLKPSSIIMDPTQRSGDFSIELEDARLAFYRQAENALFSRMAILQHLIKDADTS